MTGVPRGSSTRRHGSNTTRQASECCIKFDYSKKVEYAIRCQRRCFTIRLVRGKKRISRRYRDRAHSIGRIWLLWIRIEQAKQLEQLVLNRTATALADSVCHLLILYSGRIHQITIQWIWIRPIERTYPDLEQPNMTNRTRP